MSVEGLGCLYCRFFRNCKEGEMVPPIATVCQYHIEFAISDSDRFNANIIYKYSKVLACNRHIYMQPEEHQVPVKRDPRYGDTGILVHRYTSTRAHEPRGREHTSDDERATTRRRATRRRDHGYSCSDDERRERQRSC